MVAYLRANAESTLRGPSPEIARDIQKLQHDEIQGRCIVVWDDFGSVNKHGDLGTQGGYFTVQDTGVLIEGLNTVHDIANELGVLEISIQDSDNDEGHVQFGSGNPFRIENTAGNTGASAFEIRLKTSTVIDDGIAFFAGFGQGNVAADYLIDNSGAFITTRAFIGFQRVHKDTGSDLGTELDFVYKASGQTQQIVVANVATLVANTYIKLGFIHDPDIGDPEKIRSFVDGTQTNTNITTTNIDAATFPEGEPMLPMFLSKSGAASLSDTTYLDWVFAVQYMDGEPWGS